MTTQTPTTVNGVDITQLMETIGAIKQEPALASGQFRATSQWIRGAHSRAAIQGFMLGGQEDMSRTEPFAVDMSEAPALLGQDEGPNPVEVLLSALSGCLTTSLVYHAAARGIRLHRVESTYEGELDLRGFLGLDPMVRNGFKQIRVTFKVDADATPEQIEELVMLAQRRSPVFDMVSNPVPVMVEVAR